MNNDRLAVLWNNILSGPLQETDEHQAARVNYSNMLGKIREIDQELMFCLEEASSEFINFEMYQAFALGFQEAVGLLMGCSK
ncbi:hypothetical protein [Acetobacterium sp.]|jgi:hypothetical protein|uniref:hypothetical protein n=1 Tax=Acetobacterium sp. TaxID=1872094 RepID=UPI00272076CA|nr:hypothetical protein [Acetobacterium sp.]MDO9492485.1 hypothetical protein [Acetobacterium sp.]